MTQRTCSEGQGSYRDWWGFEKLEGLCERFRQLEQKVLSAVEAEVSR